MSRFDVYELHTGTLLTSIWVDMQAVIEYALDHYLDVPGRAGVAIATSRGVKPPLSGLEDMKALLTSGITKGFALLGRFVPREPPPTTKHVKIAQKTIALARSYARLEPESGYVDMNAAIELAKALLRATGSKHADAPVTGETISDEQICELQAHAESADDARLATTCAAALREKLPAKRGLLREHCAAAYNRIMIEPRSSSRETE